MAEALSGPDIHSVVTCPDMHAPTAFMPAQDISAGPQELLSTSRQEQQDACNVLCFMTRLPTY
jgi:hypothetical protein